MHDYTVETPNCTESSSYLSTDCGSQAGAFALFISWNVLSQYLLTNLILGAGAFFPPHYVSPHS